MERKLTQVFDNMKMPEKCAKKIKTAMETHERNGKVEGCFTAEPTHTSPRSVWAGIVAAACLVLVMAVAGKLLFSPAPQMVEVAETTADIALQEVAEEQLTELQSRFEQYYWKDEEGRVYSKNEFVAEAHAAAAPDWLMEEDGRLYFVGNSEKIDITDEITMEEPFTYIYTDSEEITWCLAVGRITEGPFVSIGHSVGWCDYYTSAGTDQWDGGGGTNWSNVLDAEYPWYDKVQKELEVPWDF